MRADAADGPDCAVGCVILAAGGARRFGGNKLLAEVGGRSLLARAIEAARASRCARVAVVLGARADELASVVEEDDDGRVERLDNAAWAEGMASSIRRAVAWATTGRLFALVLVAADQPGLDATHIDALVAASGGGRRLAASRYAGVLGVPALFPREMFGALSGLHGERGARELLRGREASVAAVAWPAGVFDIDRPADQAAFVSRQRLPDVPARPAATGRERRRPA